MNNNFFLKSTKQSCFVGLHQKLLLPEPAPAPYPGTFLRNQGQHLSKLNIYMKSKTVGAIVLSFFLT